MSSTGQFLRYLIIVMISALTLACTTLSGDQTVMVSEQLVQEKLNERLAVPVSLLKIFDIQLSNAVVNFDEQSGRMQVGLDSELTSKLFKENYPGKVSISGKLDYDASKQAVVLLEPAIEQFSFATLDTKQVDILNAFAGAMGGELLNGLVLYEVKPESLNVNGTQYAPKELKLTQQGLQITLSPEK